MRLVLRTAGLWLMALALVLLVIDGTKSLAADAVVLTSLSQAWAQVHDASLEATRSFLESRFFAALLGQILEGLLGAPAFAVLGLPGLVLALLGRRRRSERFVGQEFV